MTLEALRECYFMRDALDQRLGKWRAKARASHARLSEANEDYKPSKQDAAVRAYADRLDKETKALRGSRHRLGDAAELVMHYRASVDRVDELQTLADKMAACESRGQAHKRFEGLVAGKPLGDAGARPLARRPERSAASGARFDYSTATAVTTLTAQLRDATAILAAQADKADKTPSRARTICSARRNNTAALTRRRRTITTRTSPNQFEDALANANAVLSDVSSSSRKTTRTTPQAEPSATEHVRELWARHPTTDAPGHLGDRIRTATIASNVRRRSTATTHLRDRCSAIDGSV